MSEPQSLLAQAQACIPAFLDELRAWVDIDSGTFDKTGVDRVGELAKARFERLGFDVTIHPQAELGDHLLARRSGSGTRRLLLIGHLDTVYPAGAAVERPFTIRDGKAYGPGVFDMKSGVLAGISALELADAALDPYASVTFICNSDEEIGSPSSKDLIAAEAGNADAVLVLEPTRHPAKLTTARKGVATYTLDVTGRSAHAGVEPDAGRNAILELAHLIIALQAIHNSIPSVSVNVGAVSGGGRRNVVPDFAQALFEMRAATSDAFQQARQRIQAVVDAPRVVPDTSATLMQGPTHLPLEFTPGAQRLFAVAEQVGAALGLALKPHSTGGASDANTTGGLGIPTLDGLGLVGANSHHPDEHIVLAHIPVRLALLAGLIAALADADLR